MARSADIFLRAIDSWRNVKGWRLWASLVVIALLMVGVTVLTWATGGTSNVYPHVMYLPVPLAAGLFRAPGGIVAGLIGGLLLGPLMPLDVEQETSQQTSGWLSRTGFFVLLGALVGQLSYFLNVRLDQLQDALHNLASTYSHTLKAFTSLVAYRDEDTAGHCERVAQNAWTLGELLDLSDSELNDLYWAGILHDLGKVAVPTEILLKPSSLTPEEFDVIKKHAAIGSDLLLSVSGDFSAIAAGVRSHHERWDGLGYPDGLSAEEIPLFGRILAVVDVFEALTSKRPYREPLPPQTALEHIKGQAGQHFDPELVRLLLHAFDMELLLIGSSDALMLAQQEEPPAVTAVTAAADPN